MTVNEVLSSNNQVVSQVASMFQLFAILITLIVTIMGALAKKTADDFINDWKDKLEKLENSTKDSEKKLQEAVEKAQLSAEKAAEHEQFAYDVLKISSQSSESVVGEDIAQVTEDLEGLLPPLNQGEDNE